jgi:zinc transport system ATP-binding protein
MTLITVDALSVRHGDRRILHDVSLTVSPGEILTIVGPNGSGKSTLMRVMIGALRPETGKIARRDGLRIGYVPQKLPIDGTLPLTVLRFLNLPTRTTEARARTALTRAGLPEVAQQQLGDLSGGQLQRVLLARALLIDPHILILDEPTQGLDQPGSAAFYRQIETIRAETGCAVVMVSHDLHVVMAASDRVICLNGHVCCEGHPEHVASAPAYRALFGTGTQGALALYRHEHSHHHHDHDHHHDAATPE